MSSRTLILLLTLLVAKITADNFDNSAFWYVSTTQRPPNHQNTNNVCVAGLKEKLKLYDAQLNELKNQLQTTRHELLSMAEKQLEHKIFPPKDCKEVLQRGYKTSGMYRIKPVYSPEEFWVWCDLTTRGGGWVYLLNRFDGSENFYRNWTEYKEGFGDPSGECWLGLEHLYHLTDSKSSELLFELVDWDLKTVFERYDQFRIGNETEGYIIKTVGKFDGDAGDSFSTHVNMKFTTADRDQDINVEYNCAVSYKGAWWYNNCYHSHPTGVYVYQVPVKNYNIQWNTFHGYEYSLKQVRMMIRPLN